MTDRQRNSPNDISSSCSARNGAPDTATEALIDPIWVAMLRLYSRDTKSLALTSFAGRFADETTKGSANRYLRFMHDMQLIETKPASPADGSAEIVLTPRAIRLVERGLRAHG